MATTSLGFLELPFLDAPEPFLGGQTREIIPAQVFIIVGSAERAASQAKILNENGLENVAAQALLTIDSGFSNFAAQARIVNTKEARAASQVKIFNDNGERLLAAQASFTKLPHYVCPSFLVGPFLSDPFLVGCNYASGANQVKIVNTIQERAASQSQFVITNFRRTAAQTKIINTKELSTAAQVQIFGSLSTAAQARIVIYNTTNLRILTDFASRGTTGTNWTATSTEPGHFGVNNVNTDIVEEYWRSATGVVTGLELICDTQLAQGVFVDTFAMLNHNLSGSATAFLDASNDAGFATVETVAIPLDRTENAYWIAPSVPLVSYRYWRIRISDSANPDSFVRIGTIVFGSAVIFAGECFVDDVKFGRKQFFDTVQTEGFSPVRNDRGQKKNLSLEFRKLQFLRSNFSNMRIIFEEQSTLLKSLWIPTPQYPSRFALFGRLTEVPTETHRDFGEEANYVDFSIQVDEAE